MGVCSAAQTAQAPWGSQARCVYSLNSVCGLQGAVLGGCNCAEGESTKSVALPVAPLPSDQRAELAVLTNLGCQRWNEEKE